MLGILGNRELLGIGNRRESAIAGNRSGNAGIVGNRECRECRESGIYRECGNLQAIGNVGIYRQLGNAEAIGNRRESWGILGNWQLREFIIGNSPLYLGDSGDSSV